MKRIFTFILVLFLCAVGNSSLLAQVKIKQITMITSAGDTGIYSGEVVDKKANGSGVLFLNNRCKYQGSFVNGLREGKGNFTWPDGTMYSGDWKADKQTGKAVLKIYDGSSYDGDYIDGNIQGEGIFKWVDGSTYSGQWYKGQQEGKGTYIAANGDSYEGEWKEGKYNGFGTIRTKNGDSYEGQWVDGRQEGQGTLTLAKGASYVGSWKNGKHEGFGTFKFQSGDIYIGNWVAGKLDGDGTYFFNNGDVYTGSWKEAKQEGFGTYTKSDGSKYTGIWREGKESLHNIFIDLRDSVAYKTIDIGNQTWLAQNITYKTNSGSSAYQNNMLNSTKYGLLYTFETALQVCPVGWHIPTMAEFDTLKNRITTTPKESIASRMKASTGWSSTFSKEKNVSCAGLNGIGFDALPGGSMQVSTNHEEMYVNEMISGNWWINQIANTGLASSFAIDCKSLQVDLNTNPANQLSVRCVRENIKAKN